MQNLCDLGAHVLTGCRPDGSYRLSIDGKPIGVREKGPLFVMYPFDERPELRTSVHFSRCIWQLKSIEPPA